jgi:4a-hydroxytetrahydrobiopterin dehydratase
MNAEAGRLRAARYPAVFEKSRGAVMPVNRLSDAEIEQRLAQLPGWSIENGKLHRVFTCRDFVHAWGCMSSAALAAERMDHHPEWSNVWNRVTVDLTTHSAGGITARDFELAAKMSAIFGA